MSNAHEPLLQVDSLKITFLVDNAIEWFHKLPPGFSSELSQHLSKHSPPIDEVTGAPIIDLENYCCGAHGFSALIETYVEGSQPRTVLFDTGPDSKSLIRNIESMQVPVHKIERVILSHWHSDHSGGLLSLLRYCGEKDAAFPVPLVVDLHPDRPTARGIAPPPRDKIIGRLPADPSFDAIRTLGAVVELHAEPHVVAGNTVYVSGEIPRVTDFEQGILGGMRWVEKESGSAGWIAEPHIMDERYAAIDVLGKGLIIFSACSHAGIVNIVTDAVKTFHRPIHMVIGGLHLGGPEFAERIAPTVDFLSNRLRPSPTYVLPMHCSGFGVKVALEAALGEGCVPSGVGISVDVQGDAAAEQVLFPPVIA
ncbi:beta-lactamase-like protein [Phellopilus nigrolimitatus]|nr:beta-lactamase-like protein [Phellopilus nigrolimitatus]